MFLFTNLFEFPCTVVRVSNVKETLLYLQATPFLQPLKKKKNRWWFTFQKFSHGISTDLIFHFLKKRTPIRNEQTTLVYPPTRNLSSAIQSSTQGILWLATRYREIKNVNHYKHYATNTPEDYMKRNKGNKFSGSKAARAWCWPLMSI